MLQQQLTTDEGLQKHQQELKGKSNKFKHLWLKQQSDDDLYVDRMFYSAAGLQATRHNTRYMQICRSSDTQAAQMDTNWDLFKQYGVEVSSSEPDIHALNKLLNESYLSAKPQSKAPPEKKCTKPFDK